ncbi:MAG: hypothetical protein ACRDHU_04350 [Actinomycetota bacterium]
MDRTRLPSGSERELRSVTERLMHGGVDLPPFQTRTCTHCGRQTTFGLQDRAGWYSCLECGRLA